MTTLTPAQTMRRLCADWRVRNVGLPDRNRRRIARAAADHITAAYPSTLAQLAADPAEWTAYPEGRIDGFDGWQPDLAVAYLGDNTWLHLSVWADCNQPEHRLLLVTPCDLHGGYRVRPVQHPKAPQDFIGMGTNCFEPGDEEDLAELLADLELVDCSGDCGSVARRDRPGHTDLLL